MKRFLPQFILLAALAAFGSMALHAQIDVSLSLYGAFNGATTGNNVQQSPSNAAGTLIEVRHISNPLWGFEGTYSFNRANQSYSLINTIDCFPTLCAISGSVSASAHEATGDYVVSAKIGRLRPFALAGLGVLVNVPQKPSGAVTSLATNYPTQAELVYVYGGGLDWRLIPHIGLRFQYRGNLYKAPQLIGAFSSTNAFTHSAEPMIGAYFRF